MAVAKVFAASNSNASSVRSKIAWPVIIDYITVSFLEKDELQLPQLITFCSCVVEEIETQSANFALEPLSIARTPWKCIMATMGVNENNATDIYNRILAEDNANILFVIILYQPADEKRVLKLERQLTLDNKYAVAVIDESYTTMNKRGVLTVEKNKIDGLKRISRNIVEDLIDVLSKKKKRFNAPDDPSDSAEEVENARSMQVSESADERDGPVGSSFRSISSVCTTAAAPSTRSSNGDSTIGDSQAQAKFEPYCTTAIARANPIRPIVDGPTYPKPEPVRDQPTIGPSSGSGRGRSVPRQATPVSNGPSESGAVVNGHGRPSSRQTQSTVTRESPHDDSTDITLKLESVPSFKQTEFEVGGFYDVVVSHVSDSGDFYVQLCSQAKYIDYMTLRMQMIYLSLADCDYALPRDQVRESADLTQMWCAAPFTVDAARPEVSTNYFRATLLRRVSAALYEVFFVDYGNVAQVPFSRLKSLPETFRRVAGFAIKCRLTGVREPVDALALRHKVATRDFCAMRADDLSSPARLQVSLMLTDGLHEENVADFLNALKTADQNRRISAGRGRHTMLHS